MKKNHILTAMAVLFGLIVSTSLKAQTPTEWPDLPLLTIESIGGVMPTATIVFPLDECVGESILSEHAPGRLVMLKGADRIVNRTSILGMDFTGVDVNRLPVGKYIEKCADGTIRKVLNK